jgi:CheY-like chemotaxis protein
MARNAQQPMKAQARKHLRVLLVEDELFIRMDLAAELRRGGFEVVEAANADDALRFLETNDAPDLIFTDIQMPGKADGLILADRARLRFPDLPVVIGSGDQKNQKAAERLGVFLPKPYSSKHVVELVMDIVGPPPNPHEKHGSRG